MDTTNGLVVMDEIGSFINKVSGLPVLSLNRGCWVIYFLCDCFSPCLGSLGRFGIFQESICVNDDISKELR